MWTAKILDVPPPSGELQEYSFSAEGADSSSYLWVLFEESSGEQWVGTFRQSRIGSFQRVASPDGRHIFVAASGALYCVDGTVKELVGSISRGFACQDLLPIVGTSDVVAADFTTVTLVNPRGPIWTSPRISWDGIRLLTATASQIEGVAETGHGRTDDVPFTIDLANRSVAGGFVEDFRNWPE